MNVRELIDKLSQYPEELEVTIGYEDIENGDMIQCVDDIRVENVGDAGVRIKSVVIADVNYGGRTGDWIKSSMGVFI